MYKVKTEAQNDVAVVSLATFWYYGQTKSKLVGQIYCTFSVRESLTICNNNVKKLLTNFIELCVMTGPQVSRVVLLSPSLLS